MTNEKDKTAAEVARLRNELAALAKAYDELNAERVMMDNDCARLRTMLRSACIELCHECHYCTAPFSPYECTATAGSCFVHEWRKECGLNGGKEEANK